MEKIIFSYTFLLSRKNTNVENEKQAKKEIQIEEPKVQSIFSPIIKSLEKYGYNHKKFKEQMRADQERIMENNR